MILDFKIYYVELNSLEIHNVFSPGFKRGIVGWSNEIIKRRDEAAAISIKKRNKEDNFYIRLEESILKDGVRNPIPVNAGFCRPHMIDRMPIEWQENKNKILVNDNGGGSRLFIAQKYNLKVPCIISDHVNRFSQHVELRNEDDILQYFIDKPKKIQIQNEGEDRRGVIIKYEAY